MANLDEVQPGAMLRSLGEIYIYQVKTQHI